MSRTLSEEEARAFAVNIAPHIPGGLWELDTSKGGSSWNFLRERTTGLSLILDHYNAGGSRRVVVRGSIEELQPWKPYNSPSIEITVGADRDARAIGDDIGRRLLPELTTVRQKAEQAQAEDFARYERLTETARRLEEMGRGYFKTEPRGDVDKHRTRPTEFNLEKSEKARELPEHGRFYLGQQHVYEDSVSIQLNSMPLDLALRVVGAVAEWMDEQAKSA